jgi:hypothetical protein
MGEHPDDPVARNRAANPRTTPGRTPVGNEITNRLRRVTGAALAIATLVLVAALLLGRT